MKKHHRKVKEYHPIHRKAPAFEEQSTQAEMLETGIKVVDLLCPYQKGGKIGLFRRCRCRKDRSDSGADSPILRRSMVDIPYLRE